VPIVKRVPTVSSVYQPPCSLFVMVSKKQARYDLQGLALLATVPIRHPRDQLVVAVYYT
jgi:hypothetical protein